MSQRRLSAQPQDQNGRQIPSPSRSPTRRLASSRQAPQSQSYNDLVSIEEDDGLGGSSLPTSISNPAVLPPELCSCLC